MSHAMDPDAARADMLRLVREIDRADPEDLVTLAAEMVEVWVALDEWMSGGGFAPSAWIRRP